eukprot:Em0005g1341a
MGWGLDGSVRANDGISTAVDKHNCNLDNTKVKPPENETASLRFEVTMAAADKERNANREREKGNEAYKAGDFKEAYEYYTRSISLFPTAAAYNNRAITAIKLSRFSDAVSDCNVALKLEPTNTKALLRRANAYKSLKKNAEAIADLQSVLKLEPSNEAAKSELEAFLKEVGGAKSDATAGGSRQDSGKGFRVPVQEVKDSSDSGKGSGNAAQSNTSGAYSSTSAPKMAAAQTPPIATQAPPTTTHAPPPLPPKVNKLKEEGNAFFKAGQYGYAEQKYTQALQELVGKEQSENIALLLSNRAACYLKDGSLAKCVEDCTRSLSLSPLNVKTVIRRAQAYDSMEKYQQAYNDFQLVLKIDSTVELAATSSDRLARHLKDKHGDGWKAKLPPNPEADLAMAALRNVSSGKP